MLSKVQRRLPGSFFSCEGWVLDFSNRTLSNFTIESVGFDIQEKYGLSKGASLDLFFLKEDEATVLHLTRDLVDYIEMVLPNKDEYIGEQPNRYEKIKAMIVGSSSFVVLDLSKIDFSDLQNDEYLSGLLTELTKNADSDPASVIGQKRDLLEAVYKRILEHYHIAYKENANMAQLLGQVNEILGLKPSAQDKTTSLGSISGKILGNLNQAANGMNELRNQFGRGHGRGGTQVDALIVPRRYANLAVGLATVLVDFLIETVKRVDEHQKFNHRTGS